MSLRLESVSKHVGGEVHLDKITLEFQPGSLNVLLGPTLAGKTSLMRLMAGLDVPSEGRVLEGGKDVTGLPVGKRKVAMVYQQFINYPTLSVYENIASPLRVQGLPRADIDKRVSEAARLLKLEPLLQRTPLELSGGQQQRTAIARALVKEAELVLLDEPLANLDYKLREELREELPRIFGASGAIFVYATTEPAEALLLGGHTAALSEGRLLQYGPTSQVYRQPVSLLSARVFSDPPLNSVAVTKRGETALTESGITFPVTGALAHLRDGRYTMGFRAYDLVIADPVPGAVAVPGVVAVSEITGSESFVHVDAAGERWVALVPGVMRHEPGSAITMYLDPRRLFAFDGEGRLVAAPASRLAA
jgi:glycerol transport system ATP-binding protein